MVKHSILPSENRHKPNFVPQIIVFTLNPNLHGKNAHIRPYGKYCPDLYYGISVLLCHIIVCVPLYDVLGNVNNQLNNSGA
jgi:hypothetical protein